MIGEFNYIRNFKVGFENQCIRLFADAYHQSITDKTVKLDWNENDITGQLHEYIDNNPLRLEWSISTNVEQHLPNKSVKKVKGFANKDLRIDLRFVKFRKRILQTNQEYTVFFETKNLKEKGCKLKKRYINTGIDDFIKKKYPYGFLVGYLLEGAVTPTVKGINALLKKDNREKESLEPKKHEIVQYYFESNHAELCLKHLIFNFTML